MCTPTSCASANPPIPARPSTIVEINLSLRDYRQNLIVKKVSSDLVRRGVSGLDGLLLDASRGRSQSLWKEEKGPAQTAPDRLTSSWLVAFDHQDVVTSERPLNTSSFAGGAGLDT
jgi:hypothetical protein